MAQKPKDPFAGKVTIVQTGSAEDAAKYAAPGRVIAFLPNVSDDVVKQAKAKGASVVIWQPDWASSADTTAKAKEVDADGVIVQTEGPAQETNVDQTKAGLQGSGIPLWVVTNNYSSSLRQDVDGYFYESYSGTNSQNTVDSTASDVAHRGWTGPAYPMIGGDQLGPNNDAEVKAAANRGGYAIFPPHIGNQDETNSMITKPRGAGGSTGGNTPAPVMPPPNPRDEQGQNPKKNTQQTKKPPEQTVLTVNGRVPASTVPPSTGIDGPHQTAGSFGAPGIFNKEPYADPIPAKSYSFTDKAHRRVTITTTATGAKVEQVAGGNPYPVAPPIIPKRAANWRANPNWSGADGVQDDIASKVSAKYGIPASNIIEQRPGAPGTGNVVVRVVDANGNGVYKVVHPDGSVTDAGYWDVSHRSQVPGQPPSSSGSPDRPDSPTAPPATPPSEPTPPSQPTTGPPDDPNRLQPGQTEAQWAAGVAQNANLHPAPVEYLQLGPSGPAGPPAPAAPPPETNQVANFAPSVISGLSEN